MPVIVPVYGLTWLVPTRIEPAPLSIAARPSPASPVIAAEPVRPMPPVRLLLVATMPDVPPSTAAPIAMVMPLAPEPPMPVRALMPTWLVEVIVPEPELAMLIAPVFEVAKTPSPSVALIAAVIPAAWPMLIVFVVVLA